MRIKLLLFAIIFCPGLAVFQPVSATEQIQLPKENVKKEKPKEGIWGRAETFADNLFSYSLLKPFAPLRVFVVPVAALGIGVATFFIAKAASQIAATTMAAASSAATMAKTVAEMVGVSGGLAILAVVGAFVGAKVGAWFGSPFGGAAETAIYYLCMVLGSLIATLPAMNWFKKKVENNRIIQESESLEKKIPENELDKNKDKAITTQQWLTCISLSLLAVVATIYFCKELYSYLFEL